MIVTFWIDELLFALDVQHVQEVTPMLELTCVPGSSSRVAGVVTWRGSTIPVLDLRSPESRAPISSARVVMVRNKDKFGILIDRPGAVQESSESAPVRLLDPTHLFDSTHLLEDGSVR
jgi:chemotaxis signal transduction protein